ncbi:MAG: hypothetical protein SFZ03_03795 [Candidatus Melainabacteria bacterium]|nr:hypothetical protein [Candidatus Melainabacteria bacterium]
MGSFCSPALVSLAASVFPAIGLSCIESVYASGDSLNGVQTTSLAGKVQACGTLAETTP